MRNPSHIRIALIFATFIASILTSYADVKVLIIGSTKDSGEQHNSSVPWNSQKAAFTPNSKPFSPTAIGTSLQNILAQDGRGAVNVTVLDRYASQLMSIGWTAYSYNLATWFHYPYPAGAEASRWANLRGEAGTQWDYVVLIGDPYTMEYTPGAYAQGVAKIAEEVAKGSAELVLLMPWPGSGSSSSVNHYKEVVYRTARSGGFKVAPAGLAWQACGSPTSTSHPSSAGAYIAASSIYSCIYNQSAAASGYVSNDANANTTFSTFTNNNSAQQYTGNFTFQSPYKILDDKRRDIHTSERGTSTEDGFKSKINAALGRSRVTHTSSPYNDKYSSNTPEDDGKGWPTANPMPIAFNYGRDGIYSESVKSYVTNPSYWQSGFGYYYQNNTWSLPVEDANDLHVGLMQEQDNDLANRMINEAPTARNIPIRTLWAQIHKEYPTLNPLRDGSGPHLSLNLDEAVGTYIYTIYSGRCPLDPKPVEDDIVWTCRRIGYETAWRMGRCQARAPGFKVSPSAHNKRSVTPGATETMTVELIFPPENDVTVNVSVSNANAVIVGAKQLVFTPQNYNTAQTVQVTGLHGGLSSESFNVEFSTVSDDEVYNNLSDTWAYDTTRANTQSLGRVDQSNTLVSVNRNLAKTIPVNVTGATSSNTVLAGPSYGTVSWSGSNLVYTPNDLFVGKDGIAFAVNYNGTLTVGYFEITVNDVIPNGRVAYSGNQSTGGSAPADGNTYTQGSAVTVLGNTGNLSKAGYIFGGWNTTVAGTGTTYAPGSTFAIGSSGVFLYAKWTAAPTYSITYNGNSNTSGTVPANQTKLYDGDLTLDSNSGTLARTGYTFGGWNTAADGSGTNYAAGANYSTNSPLTLYAKWNLATYTVSYNANGSTSGSVPGNQTKTNTIALTLRTNSGNLAQTGFSFIGWNTKADGTGTDYAEGGTYTANAAVTLYAKWTNAIIYSVSYDANGATAGAAPANQNKTQGLDLTLETNSGNLVKTGYGFSGWNTAANGSGIAYPAGSTYSADAAVTLYAQWIITTYTVTYSGNGNTSGSAPANQMKTHGVNLTLSGAGTLVRTGFTFTGWNSAANGSGTPYAASATYSANAAVTLYAQWTSLPTYAVTYNGNSNTGGSAPSNQTKSQGINLTLSGAGTLVRTGYAFANWNTAANGSGTPYAGGASYSVDAAVTLYAQWTPATYSVSYNGNGNTGGSAPSNQTKTHGVNLTLAGQGGLVKTGHTFNGWNAASNGSGVPYAASATYSTNAAITLYAVWIPDTYVVSYQGNGNTGGSAPANQSKIHDVDLLLAGAGTLAKTGFSFIGWNTAANGSGTNYPAGSSYASNAPLTLYAKWFAGADGTWTADADGNWTDAANWNNGAGPVADGTDATATFGDTITNNRTVTLNGNRTIGNIIASDTTHNYTISGANILTLSRSSGAPVIDIANNAFRALVITSVIEGSNGFQKTGTGTLLLNASSPNFSGDITISAGTLRIGNNNTPDMLGAAIHTDNFFNDGTLWFTNSQSQELSGVISGSGVLNKGGSGTLTLSGANTYTGKTIIAGSGAGGPALSISSFNSVVGGTAFSSLGAPATVGNGTIQLGSSGNQRGCSLTYTGGGEITDRVMDVQFNSGAKHTISNAGAGLLSFTSNFTINPSSGTTTGGLTLGGAGNGVIAQIGTIPGILEKADAGKWTINGANASNSAIVSGGALIVNGTLDTTADISVSSNATLGGSGTVGGNVIVASGGKLEFDISTVAASHNPLDLSTGKGVTFSGTSALKINSAGGAAPGTYTLVTGGNNIAGTAPASLTLPSGWVASLSISGNKLQLVVTSTGSSGQVDHFEISSIGSPRTVGAAISGVTITAKDASNATVTAFTGTVTFGGTAGISGTSASFSSGVLMPVGITPTNVGSNLTFTVNDGFGHTGSATFTIQSVFTAWTDNSFANPFTDTLTGSNPDGDGQNNLQEFAFGTDPTEQDGGFMAVDGSAHGQPAPVRAAGNDVDFYFIRRDDHGTPGSVSYTVQFSGDLATFHDSAVSPTFVADSSVDSDYEVVKVAFPSILPDGKTARFGRIAISVSN